MGEDWIINMKVHLADQRYTSQRLPSEDDLNEFFENISTDARPRQTGFFPSVPQFDYSNSANRYRHSAYPILDALEDSWIIPSLKELNPKIDLPITSYNLIQSELYDTDEQTHRRTIPALGLSLGADIVKKIETAPANACLSYITTIKSFKELQNLKYKIEQHIRDLVRHEISIFKNIKNCCVST